jgi:hypothetical protein
MTGEETDRPRTYAYTMPARKGLKKYIANNITGIAKNFRLKVL